MGRELLFLLKPSTLVLNLAPFWHNSSCWELRDVGEGMGRGGGRERQGKRRREGSGGEKVEVESRKLWDGGVKD